LAPPIDFTFNLHLPRTNSLGFNLLYAGAALLTFALLARSPAAWEHFASI
jgi:hypothetical protein